VKRQFFNFNKQEKAEKTPFLFNYLNLFTMDELSARSTQYSYRLSSSIRNDFPSFKFMKGENSPDREKTIF